MRFDEVDPSTSTRAQLVRSVGGSLTIDVTPTVQAAAYADGEVIGGKMTISNAARIAAGSGIIQSVGVASKADLTVNLDVILFSADPSGTTFTENGAVAIAVADVAKVIDVVTISSRYDLGTPVFAGERNLGISFSLSAGRDLYACAVMRGAFTPGSTSDLTFRFGILQD